MKFPALRPNSNAFMVFSMLLLGVFSAALIIVFDYWFPTERSLSTVVLRKLQGPDVPLLWVTAIGGLTLLAIGFFFYLLSFLLLAAPAFAGRELYHRLLPRGDDLFFNLSEIALTRFIPKEVAVKQNRKYRDAFMYLLLTSIDSQTSSAARFSFTQLMYARSLGSLLVAFAIYISWVHSIGPEIAFLLVSATWVLLCALYAVGLSFYEVVMTSGILIEQLHVAPLRSHPRQTRQYKKRVTNAAPATEA
jgi:hypothetical protein